MNKNQAVDDPVPEPSERVEVDGLEHLYGMPGFLVRRAKQKTTALFIERCSEFGMTPPQYAVMRILKARPGLDQSEIANLAEMDDATIGGILERLRKRGLTVRRREGRRHITLLTDAGADMLNDLASVVAEVQREILSPLTEREQRQLKRLLSKMTETANEYHRPRRPRMRC
ncbi:MAG: MarR family transcriptional regulator [Pseudomonadales bacterium]